MDIIYLKIDEITIEYNKKYLSLIPYFQKIFINTKVYGKGTKDEPIFLDYDYDSIYSILEYLRNINKYKLKPMHKYIYDKLNNTDTIIPIKDEYHTINVSGYKYTTTLNRLCKLKYFDSCINIFKNKIPDYIDRNGKIFGHIITSLRNPFYKIPKEYEYELEYYGIEKVDVIEHHDMYLNCDKLFDGNKQQLVQTDYKNVSNSLTGNPQITFFKGIYRRYTPFFKNNSVIKDGIYDVKGLMSDYKITKSYGNILLDEMYLLIPNTISIENISDVIEYVECIYDSKTRHVCNGETNDMLLKVHSYGKYKIFKESLNGENIIIPLIFNNIEERNVIYTLDDIIIRVHYKKEIKNVKLNFEFIILSKDEQQYKLPTSNKTRQITMEKFDFNHSSPIIKLTTGNEIKTITFEIITNEILIDNFNDYLIDAMLYIDNKPISYTTPYISKKNMVKEYGKHSIDIKNIYIFDFSVEGIKYDQPSGGIICNENSLRIQLNMKCETGKLIFYICNYSEKIE